MNRPDYPSAGGEVEPLPTERGFSVHFRAAADPLLIFILAIAIALRTIAAIFFTGAIDTEGAEYARIAQNLLWGNGYVGITEGDSTQLFAPPLFSLLIAGVSLLTGDAELAGRLISVTMGALAVVPTYFIATKMYDRRTGALAAALVGCHPFLIYMSTTVHNEMIFMALVLTALCLALSCTDDPARRTLVAGGAMYGLAYLVKPDAAAYVLIAAVLIFLSMLIRRRCSVFAATTRVGLMICTFVLLAAPYAAWLSAEAGHFRIEGKSPLNVTTERRIQLGETPAEAAFGVDSLGNERGVWNRPNLITIQAHSLSFKEFAAYIVLKTRSVLKSASEVLAGSFALGSPPVFAFAIIGLFARPWSRSHAIYQVHIFGVLAAVILGTYFIYYSDLRFYVLFVPFFCIWASVGIRRFVWWGAQTASLLGLADRYRSCLRVVVWTIGVGLVLVPSMASSGASLAQARADRAQKMVGEWLRATSSGPIRILASATVISFHAGASHYWLPCCDEEGVLRYIRKKGINFVVIRKSDAVYPYVTEWLDHGIPQSDAKLVYSIDVGAREKIMIYRIERVNLVQLP